MLNLNQAQYKDPFDDLPNNKSIAFNCLKEQLIKDRYQLEGALLGVSIFTFGTIDWFGRAKNVCLYSLKIALLKIKIYIKETNNVR